MRRGPPPAATHHLKILREAELLTSVRHHTSVLHTPTALGRALLHATPVIPVTLVTPATPAVHGPRSA